MSKLLSGTRALLAGIVVVAAQAAVAGGVVQPGPDFTGDLAQTPPIPEPTALLAMGVGLATVVYAIRRKNRG